MSGSEFHAASMTRRHRLVAAVLFAVFFGMVGAAYAAVPIYRLICAATGLNGTTRRVERNGTQVLPSLLTYTKESHEIVELRK